MVDVLETVSGCVVKFVGEATVEIEGGWCVVTLGRASLFVGGVKCKCLNALGGSIQTAGSGLPSPIPNNERMQMRIPSNFIATQ